MGMHYFIRHAVAAKGLALTTICVTALLTLLSPSSLSARAVQNAGVVAEGLAVLALLLAFLGWVDILWTDITGRLIFPRIPHLLRHQFCVLLYSSIAGIYGVFAFVAADPSVHTSWILVADYLLVAVFTGVLAAATADEERIE